MKKFGLLVIVTALWILATDMSLSDKPVMGSVFYFSLHPGNANPDDTVAYVYITSPVESEIIIEKGNQKLRQNVFTKKNDFVVIGLTASEVQATTNYSDGLRETVFPNAAIRVSLLGTDSATCFVRTKYGNNSDGMSVLDISKSGVSYQITNPQNSIFEKNIATNFAAIIGLYDDTKITFRMGGCENCFALKEDGTLLGINGTIRRTLDEGDVYIVPANGVGSVLTGSQVKSNKPISVFSGSNKAYSSSQNELNYTISQELSEDLWGTSYLIPQLTDEANYPIVRTFTNRPFSDIKFNGVVKFQIRSPGGIRDDGYVESEVKDDTEPGINPVEISAESQISIMIIDPKLSYNDKLITPFQMQIIPTSSFSKTAIFHIEDYKSDFINIVYKDTSIDGTDFKMPDGLMIAEVINGKFNWLKLNDFSPDLGFSYKSTLDGGMSYRTKNIKLNKNGVYSIKSDEPIAVYQFGYNDKGTYGFSVNGSFYPFNSPDTLAPKVEFSTCCMCQVSGTVTDEPILDPENRSNLALLYMNNDNSYNYIFTYAPFVIGRDSKTTWELYPIDPTQNSRAHLVFKDKAGNRKDTIIECISKIPTIKPEIIDFGKLKLSATPNDSILTIEIIKGNDAVIPKEFELFLILDSDSTENKAGDINTYQNFDIVNLRNVNLFPLLSVGKVQIDIKFTARKKGQFKDSLGFVLMYYDSEAKIKTTQGMVFLAELKAIAAETRIWAQNYSFSSVNIESTATVELKVSNPLNGPIEFSVPLNITDIIFNGDDIGIAGSGKAFEVSGLEGISPQNPYILQPSENLLFNVKFRPKEVNEYSAEILFVADADKPDNITILTGKGEPSTSVEENLLSSKIQIHYDNGYLKFFTQENYLLDEIEIYDLSGKLMFNGRINQAINGYSKGINNYTHGVYIIKMLVNNKWISKKVNI